MPRAVFLAPIPLFLTLAIAAASCGNDVTSGTGGGDPTAACEHAGISCTGLCDDDLGCVACLNDADCGSDKPFCHLGSCDECDVSADCEAGKACMPRDHTCEDACASDEDCDDEAPVCDVSSGECVGCRDSSTCPSTAPFCEPTAFQCSECVADQDCSAARPRCDVAEHECVDCVVDADCGPGVLCTEHQCKEACGADADCKNPARPRCEAASQHCVECANASDCSVAEPVCSEDHECVGCASDGDCGPATPVCKSQRCVECDKDEDCPAASPKCEGQVCVVD
jgi:hypothetical protein